MDLGALSGSSVQVQYAPAEMPERGGGESAMPGASLPVPQLSNERAYELLQTRFDAQLGGVGLPGATLIERRIECSHRNSRVQIRERIR